MIQRFVIQSRTALPILLIFALSFPSHSQSIRHKAKLPKPIQLDRNLRWSRNPLTGKMESTAGDGSAATLSSAPAIGVVTNLVSVTCTVSTLAGIPVPGLRREDFQIFDNGSEQRVAFFDASSMPASVALILDASPSVLRDASKMRAAGDALLGALAPLDQIAVVDFAAHTYLQLPFTDVHEVARRAIARIDPRDLLNDTGGSNIYEALFLAAQKLFPGRTGRKSIVLITDGEDSGLGLSLNAAIAESANESAAVTHAFGNRLTFDDIVRALSENDIELFALSTESRPKIMSDRWLEAHRNLTLLTREARTEGLPADTLFLAELVRRVGGQLYFLREAQSFAEIFGRIGKTVAAQYTLGYYPSDLPASQTPGWHSLHVMIRNQPGAIVSHRAAYYTSPGP